MYPIGVYTASVTMVSIIFIDDWLRLLGNVMEKAMVQSLAQPPFQRSLSLRLQYLQPECQSFLMLTILKGQNDC